MAAAPTYGATSAKADAPDASESSARASVASRERARVAGAVIATAAMLCVATSRSGLSRRARTASLIRDVKHAPTSPGYGALAGDDNVQKNWPGLTCARTDDDQWGWGEGLAQPDNSSTNCAFGDTWFCLDTEKEMAEYHKRSRFWNQCNSTCNATDERRVKEFGGDARLSGASYLAVCGWQSIKSMRTTCGRDFVPTFPSSGSKNVAPSVARVEDAIVYLNGTYAQDRCGTHAMCYVCVSDDGSMDKSCEAVFNYYSFHDRYYANDHELLVASSLFWEDFDFWCTDDVLDAIDAGDFRARLQAGEYGAWKRHVQH